MVLIVKHAELSLGIVYSICVFQFLLLSICRTINSVVSAASTVLSSYSVFRLTQVLLLVQKS
jgi:hypothetical protein